MFFCVVFCSLDGLVCFECVSNLFPFYLKLLLIFALFFELIISYLGLVFFLFDLKIREF